MILTNTTPPWNMFIFVIQGKILCFKEQALLMTLGMWTKRHMKVGEEVSLGKPVWGWHLKIDIHCLCLLQGWTIPDATSIKGSLKSLLRTVESEMWIFFFFFFDRTKPWSRVGFNFLDSFFPSKTETDFSQRSRNHTTVNIQHILMLWLQSGTRIIVCIYRNTFKNQRFGFWHVSKVIQ